MHFDLNGVAVLIGIAINTSFMLLGFWGVWSFWPKSVSVDHPNYGAYVLVKAIWIGFIGAMLNVLYWRVLGDAVHFYAPSMWESYRAFGSLYGDILWKGLGAYAVWLHFYARYMSIPTDERKLWHPLAMGSYPDQTGLAYKMLMLMRRKPK